MSEQGFALRLHALMHLLVSEGHMTPVAVWQIAKIIPEPPTLETGAER